MIKRVRGENHVQPTAEEMAGRGDWDLFTEGKLGMIITGIWAFPTFTEKCAFDWDIVVEPGYKTKSTFFFANVNICWFVPSWKRALRSAGYGFRREYGSIILQVKPASADNTGSLNVRSIRSLCWKG